jgi:hypothetical protein
MTFLRTTIATGAIQGDGVKNGGSTDRKRVAPASWLVTLLREHLFTQVTVRILERGRPCPTLPARNHPVAVERFRCSEAVCVLNLRAPV